MKNIFLIHFHEVELKEKIQPLKQAGFKVVIILARNRSLISGKICLMS